MKSKRKARFRVGQVVYDKQTNEFVIYKWSDPAGMHKVFNPRCAEMYYTRIRPLTKRERGDA